MSEEVLKTIREMWQSYSDSRLRESDSPAVWKAARDAYYLGCLAGMGEQMAAYENLSPEDRKTWQDAWLKEGRDFFGVTP